MNQGHTGSGFGRIERLLVARTCIRSAGAKPAAMWSGLGRTPWRLLGQNWNGSDVVVRNPATGPRLASKRRKGQGRVVRPSEGKAA